jgi:molybdopterin-binding protein
MSGGIISTRNPIPGKVKSMTSDGCLRRDRGHGIGELASIMTSRSVQTMQLKEGDDVFVMIKATQARIEEPAPESV